MIKYEVNYNMSKKQFTIIHLCIMYSFFFYFTVMKHINILIEILVHHQVFSVCFLYCL